MFSYRKSRDRWYQAWCRCSVLTKTIPHSQSFHAASLSVSKMSFLTDTRWLLIQVWCHTLMWDHAMQEGRKEDKKRALPYAVLFQQGFFFPQNPPVVFVWGLASWNSITCLPVGEGDCRGWLRPVTVSPGTGYIPHWWFYWQRRKGSGYWGSSQLCLLHLT